MICLILDKMTIIIKKTGLFITAIFLILLGLIGIILPLMPGWLFLIPGILLLAKVSRRVDKRVTKTKTWVSRMATKHNININL